MSIEEQKTEVLAEEEQLTTSAPENEAETKEEPTGGKRGRRAAIAAATLLLVALAAVGVAWSAGSFSAAEPEPVAVQEASDGRGELVLEVVAEGWPEDGEPFEVEIASATAGGRSPKVVEVKPGSSERLELEEGAYSVSVVYVPVLEDGSTWAVPEAREAKVEEGGEETVVFDLETLDVDDAEAVEEAIASLPESEREAARQQYQKKVEKQSAGGGSPASSGGTSSTGGTGSSGGAVAQPEEPAACNHDWVEQGSNQNVWVPKWETVTITEYKCNGCTAVFDNREAAEAHGREMAKAGTPHGGYTGGTYTNDVDNGGYQSQWVGNGTYKCSKCGATK